MRLIDTDSLKYRHKDYSGYDDVGDEERKHGILFLLEEDIAAAPTVDPVKHGEWIIRDNPGTGWYRVTCSECGEDVTSTVPVIGFFPNAEVIWEFCPYCGARNGLGDMHNDNKNNG